jgi:ABC-2 type transport system permease protein
VKALVIARRELAAYFYSPISWIVMTLFLVATGYEFWLLAALLNGRETPHGAVLQYFFGGTFLYWLFLMFIVAVISMRLVAEERRMNTLEPLLTAPVREADVIVGKFLGALAFYGALWLPTLLYVLVLRSYGSIDLGPIVAGYLGTLLVGASTLSLGLFFSTLTKNQIVAAVLSFVVLAILLLIGALGDALFRTGPSAALLQHVNLFRHMEDFGRGLVDSRHVIYHLSLALLGLYAATRVLLHRKKRAIAEVLLLVAILAGANVLAARHYLRTDWTRGHTFALSDKTRQILRGLQKPVNVIVFMLPSAENDLYDDVRELLDRAQRETPLLKVDFVDVDRDRDRALTLGKKYNVGRDDVTNGVVIVDAGGPAKFIPRDELAEYDDQRVLVAWKGEQALMQSLLTVTEEKSPEICFVKGHGEPAIDSFEPGEYGDFAEELKRDHYAVRAIDLDAGIPTSCNLVVEAGPEQPLPKEHLALLGKVDRLLVLDGPHFDSQVTRFVDTGLEPLLVSHGIALGNNVVVDEPRLRGSAVSFAVSESYADHPITSRLMHRRTIWSMVRQVRSADARAKELIHTSDDGWGETNLGVFHATAELSFDPKSDVKGPVAVAAASQHEKARVVVFGSSEIAGNRQVLGYNRDLLLNSVAWLLDLGPRVAIGPRTPEHLHLSLDDGQLTRIFLLSVIALPFCFLLLGAGVYWVRRA